MRRMLVSRISRRVLAEHHIALSDIHAGKHSESSGEPHVGIIFTGLDVRRSIAKCAKHLRERPIGVDDCLLDDTGGKGWPNVVIDGQLDTKFAYIREHLEFVRSFFQIMHRTLMENPYRYIVFELLKNVSTGIQPSTSED